MRNSSYLDSLAKCEHAEKRNNRHRSWQGHLAAPWMDSTRETVRCFLMLPVEEKEYGATASLNHECFEQKVGGTHHNI